MPVCRIEGRWSQLCSDATDEQLGNTPAGYLVDANWLTADVLFFNPATFHAAGENRSSDIDRIVNLMQIGSGYGRSNEIVDRVRMCLALYPTLRVIHANGEISASVLHCIIAACAEGYPFPANLDLDSPLSGMAPESQQQLMQRAVENGLDDYEFEAAILEQQGRKRSH